MINIKKKAGQSLNDFISKFETLHYSLNAADHSFQEQGPMEKDKDFSYYMNREKFISRKLELNKQ